MTYVFDDCTKLSGSTGGAPIQLSSAAVDWANSVVVHAGSGTHDGTRQTVFQEVSLYITNRHSSTAATVVISYSSSGGDMIYIQVPAQTTVSLFSDGRPLVLTSSQTLRVHCPSGPAANNISVMGKVTQATWE